MNRSSDEQQQTQPILVISDNSGNQIHGSIVTSEDGRHVFVDSSNSVSHELMKADSVDGGHYEISITKPLEHTHGGESVLTSVADTSLIMAEGTDFQTPDNSIHITYAPEKRKAEDALDEQGDKKAKY